MSEIMSEQEIKQVIGKTIEGIRIIDEDEIVICFENGLEMKIEAITYDYEISALEIVIQGTGTARKEENCGTSRF